MYPGSLSRLWDMGHGGGDEISIASLPPYLATDRQNKNPGSVEVKGVGTVDRCGQGPTSVVRWLFIRLRLAGDCLFVAYHPVPARILGMVQGLIGAPNQLVKRLRILVLAGNPKAGRKTDLAPLILNK